MKRTTFTAILGLAVIGGAKGFATDQADCMRICTEVACGSTQSSSDYDYLTTKNKRGGDWAPTLCMSSPYSILFDKDRDPAARDKMDLKQLLAAGNRLSYYHRCQAECRGQKWTPKPGGGGAASKEE